MPCRVQRIFAENFTHISVQTTYAISASDCQPTGPGFNSHSGQLFVFVTNFFSVMPVGDSVAIDFKLFDEYTRL